MFTRISLTLTFLCCSATRGADAIRLNIKPGLWETAGTREMSGQPLVPPEAREEMAKMQEGLSKLPPEQRAKIEAMSKANASTIEAMTKAGASQAQTPAVGRICVKKEDLDKPIKLTDVGEGSCTRTMVASSSSKQEIRAICTTADGMKQTITLRVDVVNSENFKFSAQSPRLFAPTGTKARSSLSVADTFSFERKRIGT